MDQFFFYSRHEKPQNAQVIPAESWCWDSAHRAKTRTRGQGIPGMCNIAKILTVHSQFFPPRVFCSVSPFFFTTKATSYARINYDHWAEYCGHPKSRLSKKKKSFFYIKINDFARPDFSIFLIVFSSLIIIKKKKYGKTARGEKKLQLFVLIATLVTFLFI